jgi:hypothetical protein
MGVGGGPRLPLPLIGWAILYFGGTIGEKKLKCLNPHPYEIA